MNRDYGRQIPPAWKNMARVFRALGDEHRQRILLVFENAERLNAGQIAEVSTLARPTVSHHLKVLRDAGVLSCRKEGREVWFWVDKRNLRIAAEALLDHLDDTT